MMTMMMMQRLLQENSSENSPSSISTVRPFNFSSGGTVLHHHPSSAFLRPPSSKSDDTKDSTKDAEDDSESVDQERLVEDDKSDCGKKDCDERLSRTPEDVKSRVSDESMDIEERTRLSSDEDFLTVDDDLGSPVDLTSNQRFLNRLHQHAVAKGLRRQLDTPSPSSVSEANDDPPRRLAFSVENILDPTKFTGKEKEVALVRPRFQTHWRPLDVLNTSPDLLNHSGNSSNM